MEGSIWIAIGAVIVSGATLIMGTISMRSGSERRELEDLRKEVASLRSELNQLHHRVRDLEEENYRLLQRLFAATGEKR